MTTLTQTYRIDPELARQAWSAICEASTIAIISHRHPDPDSVGSNLALRELLQSEGKKVDSYSLDSPPPSCRELIPDCCEFSSEFDPQNYDLIICVDCGSLSQVAFDLSTNRTMPLINIDHHTSNNNYGQLNLVFPSASSTSEIIFKLLEIWEKPVTVSQATALLMGIYFDTGSFMHSNVSCELLEIASGLILRGADLSLIKRSLYRNFSEKKFHLWGDVLGSVRVTDEGAAVAVITPENVRNHLTGPEDTGGLIDYVCMAKDSRFALMVTEEEKGQLRGSIRTRHDQVDVYKIAQTLGGGGHKKASGFSFPGTMRKESLWKITN